MKTISIFLILTILSMNLIAQKQSFDVLSFSIPKTWQQKQFAGGVQYSITDNPTGGYAIALITQATASDAGANDNFSLEWNRLVKAAVQVNAEPSMLDPTSDNGWEIISGTANYTDGNQNGIATLLTATGGGQMTSVLLMTNTSKYQEEIMAFISSLKLTKTASTGSNTVATNQSANSSIVGMWVHYNTESSGTYNGFPQLTGGYMRREYVFYSDGSYLFRSKHWMVYVKDILYVYESGTYSVNGNKLTLSPSKGKGEFWSKIPNNTKAWGKLVKSSSDYKQEKTTYTFELWPVDGQQNAKLSLKSPKPTERDGSSGETNVHQFIYESWNIKESKIDNPPGFKTGFENKPLVAANSSSNSSSGYNASIATSPDVAAKKKSLDCGSIITPN